MEKAFAALLVALVFAIPMCAEDISLSLKVTTCSFVDQVYIDGVATNEMAYSGKPFNVTIVFISPAFLEAVEYNGYAPFALPQYADSNVSNYAIGNAESPAATYSFTLVPTGAEAIAGFEGAIGNYSAELDFTLASNPLVKCIVLLNVTNRTLERNYFHVSIPNRDHVSYFNDYVYRVYSHVKQWRGGEKRNVTVYTNGTADGDFSNLTAGKPAELNVTVLNDSTLAPVQGAFVQVTEYNGFQSWSGLQFQDYNLSNEAVGRTVSGSDGNARITIIPTGGLPSVDAELGPYQVNFSVYSSNTLIYSRELLVSNRGLTTPPGTTGQAVANQANIDYFNDYVFRVYAGVKEWLWR